MFCYFVTDGICGKKPLDLGKATKGFSGRPIKIRARKSKEEKNGGKNRNDSANVTRM